MRMTTTWMWVMRMICDVADGEGIPDDGGATTRVNELATCKHMKLFA